MPPALREEPHSILKPFGQCFEAFRFGDTHLLAQEIVQTEEDRLHVFDQRGPYGLVLGTDKDLLEGPPVGHRVAAHGCALILGRS